MAVVGGQASVIAIDLSAFMTDSCHTRDFFHLPSFPSLVISTETDCRYQRKCENCLCRASRRAKSWNHGLDTLFLKLEFDWWLILNWLKCENGNSHSCSTFVSPEIWIHLRRFDIPTSVLSPIKIVSILEPEHKNAEIMRVEPEQLHSTKMTDN